jgi:hypothetical protein
MISFVNNVLQNILDSHFNRSIACFKLQINIAMQCDTGENKTNKKINEGLQKFKRKITILIKKQKKMIRNKKNR